MDRPKIAVIYYSATGTVYRLARAVAEGAAQADADVRLRQIRELVGESAVEANPAWAAHHRATREIPLADQADLEWADGYVFGTPTRHGGIAAQLKFFFDTTASAGNRGRFADRVAAGFTAASHLHGGHEATLLSLYGMLSLWGCILAPPGFAHPSVVAGGNPFGVSATAAHGLPEPSPEVLAAAHYLGARVATISARLRQGRPEPTPVV